MVERAAKVAGFDMKIHSHMLRHSCGFDENRDAHPVASFSFSVQTRSAPH
jgi:hypothetical protein